MARRTRTVQLSYNNGAERLELPLTPDEITIAEQQLNQTETLLLRGLVSTPGPRGLMSLSLSTFLPGARSPFNDGLDAAGALEILRTWQQSQRPIRVILSGTRLNDAFLINALSHTYREGDGDTLISLELQEYKFLTVEAVSSTAPLADNGSGLLERADTRAVPKTHTIISGDTLWDIAVRYLGDGSRWSEITLSDGSAIVDPRNVPIGQEVALPDVSA